MELFAEYNFRHAYWLVRDAKRNNRYLMKRKDECQPGIELMLVFYKCITNAIPLSFQHPFSFPLFKPMNPFECGVGWMEPGDPTRDNNSKK